jgi:hypothetical protein
MNGYHTSDFIRTGRAGIITDIGKGREPGASSAINLDRKNRDRSSEIKGNSNINRGPMFSDISNRYNSNINRGLMFGDISNRYNSNKDNASFNNKNNNRGGVFSGSKYNPGFSNSNNNPGGTFSSSNNNLGFSNNKNNNRGGAFSGSRDNHRSNNKNTLSLKESIKEEGSLEGSE